MGLLQYKSDEMYSSTELIRKSKMIFNKVLNNDIEKAIILRDGKPSFLLMEFTKYERIMAEFEELKSYVESIKEETIEPKKGKKKKNKNKNENRIDNPKTEKDIKKKKEKFKNIEEKIVLKEVIIEPKKEKIILKTENFTQSYDDIKINTRKENKIKIEEEFVPEIEEEMEDDIEKNDEVEEDKEVIVELSEEEEIQNALKSIEAMNFDDEMKEVAESKIKIKIIEARRVRAEQLALSEEVKKEEEQEELEMEQQIEEEKRKKERELKEFWD